jgi:hypothetical protein
VSVFVEYVKRYEALMETLYSLTGIDDLEHKSIPDTEEVHHLALKYLNLCSEEYYLWRAGFLDRGLWKIWEKDIKATLRSNLIEREWPKLECRFGSYSEFSNWVGKVRTANK